MIIYHNPRCRKSRETLKILEEKNVKPDIIEYLKTPPDKEELKEVLDKLNKKPEEVIRKNEKVFKENFKGKDHTDEEWIEIIINHPELLERPIVVKGDKAVIGRPPSNVKTLL